MLSEERIVKIERQVLASFNVFNAQVADSLGQYVFPDGSIDIDGMQQGYRRLSLNFAADLVGVMLQGSAIAAKDAAADFGLTTSFDPSDFRTTQQFQIFKDQIVQGLQRQQQEAILEFRNKLATNPTARTAAEIRESLTLTARQIKAVDNYRNLLETNSKQALSRQLRDRRSDASVLNAISRGKALPQERIDSMVNRYRERQLNHRAKTIATTEGVKIANQSDHLYFEQAVERGEVTRGQITRQWINSDDEDVRPSHSSIGLLDQRVAQDAPFVTGAGNSLMYPGDPSAPLEDIINCRCYVNTIVVEAAEQNLLREVA